MLARMLRNLKEIHRSAEDWPRLLAVTQRLVILLPESWSERRDRGLAYAEMGFDAAAADDLRTYFEQAPDDPLQLVGGITDGSQAGAGLVAR